MSPTGQRSLSDLTPTEFENLTYDLVRASGMRNLSWRTPGADVGRDLEGDYPQIDFAGFARTERWFIECKRYATAIGWPIVWEKIAYADSQNADTLLIVTQSTFSPQCIDQVNLWNVNHKRPTVRLWPVHELEIRIRRVPHILFRYNLASDARNLPAAIAPLAQQLARMTISASDNLTFSGNASPQLEAAVALSKLIMIRTSDLEDSGAIVFHPASSLDLQYGWARVDGTIPWRAFDGPHLRTMLPLVAMLYRSKQLLITPESDGRIRISPENPPLRLFKEMGPLINLVDGWGFAQTEYDDQATYVRSTR